MAGTPSALWTGGPPGVGGPLSLISPYDATPIAQLPHAPQAALRPHSLPEADRLLVQAATNRHRCRGGAAGAGGLDVDRNHVDPLDEEVNVNVNVDSHDEALEEEVEEEAKREEEVLRVWRADTTECALGSPGSPRALSHSRSAGRDERMEHDAESRRVPGATEALHRTPDAAADVRLASEHYRCAASVPFSNL